ncbi:DUF1499 domain-containing protein [Marinomonas colpomeniae]|uniref:DUF1499 domain-containing protein n=1 Tax=Marinomonas colpomeniae TaxID=2774408 RepID=A0ABR8NUZ2_9GAMM|nr:DUF1499 domain-containing protein [Marinomonas colpomeniae]MBD5769876.1 DUF1499 domain-containing protein [Marinomonas colpomeniae]
MVRWIIAVIVVLIIGLCVYVSFSNKLPDGLGVTDGLLKACPASPNCISTQAEPSDTIHYIEPIVFTGESKDAQLLIESYMLAKEHGRLVTSSFGYVHFEVKSQLIGYIDDVEFYFPEADSVVHVRSASRVGYSDMGVNRNRVRQIQNLLVN